MNTFLAIQNQAAVHLKSTIVISAIGGIVGFLSGLLGKGGSAISTPALQIFAGISPLSALASPLPATLPTTLSASYAYRGKRLINLKVAVRSVLVGMPFTFIGSYFTTWIDGAILMLLTALFVLAIGVSFFFVAPAPPATLKREISNWKIFLVAGSVGFLSGLLANSGGVLFGPLFIRFLKMPTKEALATSLIVAAGLAIPGTIAHWYLNHIDWLIVLFLSITSIPCSYLGAKLAIKIHVRKLEAVFAIMLIAFGLFDILYTLSGL